jgi:hypothetical protein
MNFWTQPKNLQLCVLKSRLGPTCHRLRGGLLLPPAITWTEESRRKTMGLLAWLVHLWRGPSSEETVPWEERVLLRWSRGEGESGVERRRRAGAAIFRAELCTYQTAPAGGRWKSVDIGRPFLAFSVWNRTLISIRNIFLDLPSTIFVRNLRWFEHWLGSYRPTKIGLLVAQKSVETCENWVSRYIKRNQMNAIFWYVVPLLVINNFYIWGNLSCSTKIWERETSTWTTLIPDLQEFEFWNQIFILSWWHCLRYLEVKSRLGLNITSRLTVCCDGLQQYPRKLSTNKISRFFIDCLHSSYNIFLIWLTDVIVYSMQYVFVQHGQWSERLEESSQRLTKRTEIIKRHNSTI